MDSRVLWVCACMREYTARGHRMHRCTYVRTGRAGRSAAAGTHSCRSGSVYAHKYSARRHTGTIFVEYGSMFPGARLCMHAYASKHTDICLRGYTCTRIPANRQMSRVCLASNANTTQCTKRTWLQGFGGVSLQTMGLIGGLSAGALLLLCAIMLFLWSVNNIHLCATSYLFVSVCLFAKACARAHTHIIFRNQEAARGARVGS